MQHITGISRNQMTFSSLEDTISLDNPIRFIDDFVENIDLRALGFEVEFGFIPNFLYEPKNTRKPSKNYFIKKEDYKSSWYAL